MSVAIIGGGAAGMMAAARLISYGFDVTLYEKNARLGRKLAITGKGRCNVTNNCTADEFFKNVPTNPRFLYSSYSSFNSQDVMAYFESLGVPLKTERGDRVFPVSDKAFDIVDALASQVRGHVKTATVSGICVEYTEIKAINEIWPDGNSFLVALCNTKIQKENPELFEAISKAFEQAIDFIDSNKQGAAEIISKYLEQDIETTLADLSDKSCSSENWIR